VCEATRKSTAVFQPREHMGFRESEARRAVDSVCDPRG
jgi:hypothetical protein